MDVLIVEDEPVARRALRLLLTAHGYETAVTASAEDALKRVALGEIPKVVLVDLDLPGMNGLELIERLEVLSPTIYPVLVTAADWKLVEQARPFPGMGYMQKPIDLDRLFLMIDQFFQGLTFLSLQSGSSRIP